MAKRHREQHTKKETETVQPSLRVQTKPATQKTGESNCSAARKVFSRGVTVLSILLNFWLAYLTLTPKVTVDYASHLVPENPIALPIKIINIGLLPVYDVECFIEDKGIKTINGSLSTENISHVSITRKLSPNKPAEYVHGPVYIGNNPVSGMSRVTLKYKLPVIHMTITSEPNIFSIYKSKDGFTRWIHR